MSDLERQFRSVRAVSAVMNTWLDQDDLRPTLEFTQHWDAHIWQMAQQMSLVQGIGPCLHQRLSQMTGYQHLDPGFRQSLQTTYERNDLRIQRLHADLQTILRMAGQAGIPVMPIKGSLLTTTVPELATLRPMADLDLLVHPEHRKEMGRILQACDYRFKAPASRWSHHDLYLNPQGGQTIIHDEHPDNPRPVELHWSLERKLWADYAAPDLTHLIWTGSRPGHILGEPAQIPRPEHHLAYLALHGLGHLLLQSGRLIQWLDLVWLARIHPDLGNLPAAELLYPIFRLTARAFPRQTASFAWHSLPVRIAPRIHRWCERTPIDASCGLQMPANPKKRTRWHLRWRRWHPTPIRLALIYPQRSLPGAYLRYTARLLRLSEKVTGE